MENKINFEILSKEDLKKLSLEELRQAKKYFEYYNDCNKNLQKGIDYRSEMDYDNNNDINYYDEKIDYIDSLISSKK